MAKSFLEEREELMISPTGGLPTLRKAYFLRPNVNAIEGPSLKLPYLTPIPRWPLKVAFNGWRDPLKKWKTWTENMHSRYSSVWKNAGIYEAVIGSIYKINRNDDLIFGFAERWNSGTNTFIFPWGEATITLEDIMIMGGYSVLGDSVFLPLETEELIKIEDFLEKNRKILEKLKQDGHCQWLNVFMDSGGEFEHEAFLSLWLSRFVFPVDKIGDHVFAIAIRLARGQRLALGPAVLASIYRDLGLLKESMAASVKLSEHDNLLYLTLWSPLQFLQVWAWERLPPLQPEPNFIGPGTLRIARWASPKKPEIGNMRPAIESAGVTFLWRPYTISVDNWSFPMMYKEKEELIKCDNLSIELESFVRCLRACHIVGIDCQEPYNPHRVAMQFGLDQDLPRWISRENMSPEIAWFNYNQPLSDDEMLYIPTRLFESDVSTRYLDWWRKTVICPLNPVKGLVKGRRSTRKHRKCVENWRKIELSIGKDKKNLSPECLEKLIKLKTANDPEVPPGFIPLCNRAKVDQPCDIMNDKETMWMQRMVNVEEDKVHSTMVLKKSLGSNSEKLSYENFANFNLEALSAFDARMLRLESEIAKVKDMSLGSKD